MTQKIRLWQISEESKLVEIPEKPIDKEIQLEDWLEEDISILDANLLVIGRQVGTDYGGQIDLLCLDSTGDTVVIELKRGMTPRDVTAQALDYASWVKDLSTNRLIEIANEYLVRTGRESLELAYQNRFESDLPDELNLTHRSLIVAESMDASTERIVRYLAGLDVPINVATVQHHKDTNGQQFLTQTYWIEQEEPEAKRRIYGRGQARQRLEKYQEMADANGFGVEFRHLNDTIGDVLPREHWDITGLEMGEIWYRVSGYTKGVQDGKPGVRTVLKAFPNKDGESLSYLIHGTRLMNHFGLPQEELQKLLPMDASAGDEEVRKWRGSSPDERTSAIGFKGYFTSTEQIDTFIYGLKRAQQKQS